MDSGFCWQKDELGPGECALLGEEDAELRTHRPRRIQQLCLDCSRFRQALFALEEGGNTLAGDFARVAGQLRSQVKEMGERIRTHHLELSSLHEVGLELQATLDMNRIIATALTAVTAGKGFGLNRAILLLVNREETLLRGYLAIGPRKREEAGPIWHELALSDATLPEMAREFCDRWSGAEKAKFADLLECLTVPLSQNDHLFVSTLTQGRTRLVSNLRDREDIAPSQLDMLEVNETLLVPLQSGKKRIGLLMADNIVSGHHIAADNIQSLETFSQPVAFAIERADLHGRLQERLREMMGANLRMKEQQELILRMERMALAGKITTDLAHTIRNPLMIIGGYARALEKNFTTDNPLRASVEAIAREAMKAERALKQVLDTAESLGPSLAYWDLHRLVDEVVTGKKEELSSRGIQWQIEGGDELPLVHLDYAKIAFCLRTMIDNACRHMPGGGDLLVRTGQEQDQAFVCLAEKGQVLRPGRAEPLGAYRPGSNWMEEETGLALCARILEEQGGRLHLDHTGEGSTFTLCLNLPREENRDGATAGR